MSLNIKNERVHAMVREAAERTGMSQTSVVEEALRRMLKELDERESAIKGSDWEVRHGRIMAVVADFHSRLTPESKALALADDLYDDEGKFA
jgi:antitoxin VapB